MRERTLSRRNAFKGRLLKVDILEVELDNGIRARREIVRHPGAVVIVAERPDGSLVLVRQYRKAIESELLEFCAGTLEPGEKPAACAARELQEETGFTAAAWRKLGLLHLAPGYSEERLHVFHARLRPTPRGGAPDADETLQVVTLSRAEFERRIAAGRITDAKTLAAWTLRCRRLTASRRRRQSTSAPRR